MGESPTCDMGERCMENRTKDYGGYGGSLLWVVLLTSWNPGVYWFILESWLWALDAQV